MSFIRNLKQKSLIVESYGSFKGQFDIVQKTANTILSKIDLTKNGNYRFKRMFDEIGVVHFEISFEVSQILDVTVTGVSENNNGENILTISISYDSRVNKRFYGNLAFTLAHEIMHTFQRFKKTTIRGTNGVSGEIYQNVLNFRNNATTYLVKTFFDALYYCNNVEISANVSAVSNFLATKVPQTASYNMCKSVLTGNDAYNRYREFISEFSGVNCWSFSEEEKKYIQDCLINNNVYDSSTFNINTYLNKTIKMICNKSIYAMKKMEKNIKNFLNVDKR